MSSNQNILNKKMELIQWISAIDDISIIEKIMDVRKKETVDWWQTISDKEKKSIQLGLDEANAGNLNAHIKARKLYEKWL